MERLTKRSNKTVHDNGVCCTHFNGFECSERMGECTDNCPWEEAVWSKLADYEDKQEQGLLIELPCKVGDTIYKIPSKVNYDLNIINRHPELNRVYEQIVHSVEMYRNDSYLLNTCEGMSSVHSDFYKETWFLTRSEAEEALAKMGGKQ